MEKAFLLCEEFQKKNPRTHRLTRHYYYLERLSHTPYADEALSNAKLYKAVVEHRKRFYHVGAVDYDKELPENISLLPPPELMKSYADDYKEMQISFFYGKSLSFEALMKAIGDLQKRFRTLHLD